MRFYLKQIMVEKTIGCKGVLILIDTLNLVFDSIGATQIEMLEFVESIKEICSNISSIKAKEEPKTKSKSKKVEKYEDDYYDEDDDDDDMAAIRARKSMFKKPAQTTNEDEDEQPEEKGASMNYAACLTFNVDLFLNSKFLSLYNEIIKKNCDLLFEVHNNESGYSMDVDGAIEVKKYIKDENELLSIKTKIKRKFKIRENKVDYFEFISI